jgi:hypothetical protein
MQPVQVVLSGWNMLGKRNLSSKAVTTIGTDSDDILGLWVYGGVAEPSWSNVAQIAASTNRLPYVFVPWSPFISSTEPTSGGHT